MKKIRHVIAGIIWAAIDSGCTSLLLSIAGYNSWWVTLMFLIKGICVGVVMVEISITRQENKNNTE